MKKKLSSISVTIFAGIFFALFVSIGLAGLYTLEINKTRLYSEFKKDRDNIVKNIAMVMADPIYYFSPNNGSLALGVIKQDYKIVSIEVYDSLNDMDFIEISIPNRKQGNFFETINKVYKNKQEIGWVKVVFNDLKLTTEMETKKILFAKVFVFTFLANLFVLIPLLYIKIFRPLKILVSQAHDFQDNKLDTPFVWTDCDEINVLGKGFEVARISVLKHINDLEKSAIELERLAVTDNLTQLYNRNKLNGVLENEIKRSERFKNTFGVIILDIDFFKSVNDTHGHNIGDQILIEFAKILQSNIRKTDIVGRWGGEEFLIICPEVEKNGLLKFTENIRKKIEEYIFPIVGQKTASFGISIFKKGDDSKNIVKRADTALYEAKETGRNKTVFKI